MTEETAQILIVDDDPEITSALARGLALHGYVTLSENRAEDALERFKSGTVSAAIVDVMIGADSGIDLVRSVRQSGNTTPILMLSALSEVEDRTRGLEAGADDYIVKPFSFDELVARLKVQQLRTRTEPQTRTRLDATTWSVSTPARRVTLTEREFALLHRLASHPDDIHSRVDLFEALWAGEGASSENVVDVYLGYLRKKLDPVRDFGFEIKTLRNRGFKLEGVAPEIL